MLEATTFLTIFASIFLFTVLGDEWDKANKAAALLALGPAKGADSKAVTEKAAGTDAGKGTVKSSSKVPTQTTGRHGGDSHEEKDLLAKSKD